MIERKIKELSIALEALSRVNGRDEARRYITVGGLLDDAIEQAKQENGRTRTKITPDNTDDIPF